MPKTIKSALINLPPHQRKKLLGKPTARVFLGRNLLKHARGFEISDALFEKNKAEIRDLQVRGEIEVFENGHPYQWPARKPRPATQPRPVREEPRPEPVVVEPAPKPAPEPEPEPDPEPDTDEPTDDESEDGEPASEDATYTAADLRKMTNAELIALAEEKGLGDMLKPTMVKKEIIKVILVSGK